MNRFIFSWFIVIFSLFLEISCKNGLYEENGNNREIGKLSYDIDDFDTNFGKALYLTLKATGESANVLQRNGLMNDVNNTKGVSLTFADLYKPSMIKSNNDKVLEELEKLQNDYQSSLEKIVPSFDECVGKGLLKIENENIIA